MRNLARRVTGLVLGQGIHWSPIARAGLDRMAQAPSPVRQRLLSVGLAFRKRTVPLAWSVHRGPKCPVGWEAQRARRWRPIWTPARASR